MAGLIALIALPTLLAGVALGWYLRRVHAWCPRCGGTLTCATCGARPTWLSPSRSQRPVR